MTSLVLFLRNLEEFSCPIIITPDGIFFFLDRTYGIEYYLTIFEFIV